MSCFDNSVIISHSCHHFCTVVYNGLYNAGLDGSNAYLTANLEFVSLEYLLAKNQLVDLCDETWVAPSSNAAADDGEGRRLEEQNNCDLADGTYAFELPYTLPDYQDNMSWLATGWRGAGYIKMYSDDSSSDEKLIGSCTFKFDTMVTKNDAGGMTPPTAAMTLAILAGVFAAGGLLCCYMSFCCGKKNKTKASSSDTTTGGSYKRTEDDGTLMSSKDGSSRGL